MNILPEVLSRMPDLTNTVYMEPFVGGGSVFANAPGAKIYWLYDVSCELINVFKEVQMNASELEEILFTFAKAHSREFYKSLREIDHKSRTLAAARFIYLNKTCFNGLYRVNKKGKFNVPIGSYKNPKILDADNLKLWCQFLNQKTKPDISSSQHLYNFDCKDFRSHDYFPLSDKVFCYCDPPFDGVFSSYTKNGFTRDDQAELLSCLQDRERINDFKWMVSNNSTPFIHALYKDYNIEVIPSTKSIKGGHRQKFNEVIIRNY